MYIFVEESLETWRCWVINWVHRKYRQKHQASANKIMRQSKEERGSVGERVALDGGRGRGDGMDTKNEDDKKNQKDTKMKCTTNR
jgi:hypothetical protein